MEQNDVLIPMVTAIIGAVIAAVGRYLDSKKSSEEGAQTDIENIKSAQEVIQGDVAEVKEKVDGHEQRITTLEGRRARK